MEEQFYFIAPLCFWMVHMVAPRLLRPTILVATLGSLGLFFYSLTTGRLCSAFYLLPTRAWELGAGCCLAAFLRSDDRQESSCPPWHGVAGLLGLGLIMTAYGLAPCLNWMASLAVAGTVLVLAFGKAGAVHWLLTRSPLIWLGKASYSIYLWHWPVIVLSKLGGQVSSI